MEDFYMNITSQDNSYDYSNITYNYSNITYDYYDYSNITYDYYDYSYGYVVPWSIKYVVTWIIIGFGLPLTLIAIYALYSQVRNDHVAPIYVINLLISDLIQFCCMIAWVEPPDMINVIMLNHIYQSVLVVSVCFMVCIALERYLVVAHPLWYRFRRSIKSSVVICVLVWALALVFALIFNFSYNSYITYVVFLLFPFPLFMFFLGGTLKALSASISVPSDEKRRIVAVLILVLLIYTLLFLPDIIYTVRWMAGYDQNDIFSNLSIMFLRLSPLIDSALYVFMRKGTVDKLLSSVCCCRMDSDDTNSPSV